MSDPVKKQLYDAAGYGRVSEVSSLLRDHPGIDVNWKDFYQWTSLHMASNDGHAEVVKLLLAHPNIKINLKNSTGQTPVSLGCESGKVSVVRMLLKDPRVDVTLDDKCGRTPLWWASCYGHHDWVSHCK